MKTEYDTQQAAKAALKKAIIQSISLVTALQRLEDGHDGFAEGMPRVRSLVAEVTQRVHEFNAYNNVVHGGNPPRTQIPS